MWEDQSQAAEITHRYLGNCNWLLFEEHLKQGLVEPLKIPRMSIEFELTTDFMTTAIMSAYEISCPLKVKKGSRVVPW